MLKILYIVTQSELGGAQRYIFDLASNLPKNEYIVNVAAGGEGKPPFANKATEGKLFDRLEGVKIASHKLKHLVRAISPVSDIKAYFEIKQLISNIQPDIVHLNSSKAGFLGSLAAKACKTPKIIYTAHGFVFNEPMNPIKRWIYKKAELSSAKRVHQIICVSEYDRQSGIKTGIPENKLITIHNGINPDIKFLTKEDALMSLRLPAEVEGGVNSTLRTTRQSHVNYNEHGIATVGNTLLRNDKIIGCIANFYRTKGLDILIQAMTKIDAQLVIIGDGVEKENLRLMTYDLKLQDKILFAGQIQNASQYLKAFDLFVLASRKEGLPYTILEATSAQIPIVATKVGGVPEIIEDNKNGYLAQPDNVDDLADKMNQALKNPIASNLADDFTLNKMLGKTIEVYTS